jgi:hypothetical protein
MPSWKLDHRLPEGCVRLVGKPAPHAFYEDRRSPTGLTFYCRTENWRFIVRVEDFFVFCPACGKDHRAETMSENGLWAVARGKAP